MAKPKLALIPAAQGTKLYSVLPSDGSGDFDYTRGSSATRINAQGLIESVANTSSRLNYPLLDGKVVGCPHHLLEPQRTNLIIYSEDFSQYSDVSGADIFANTTISPDGTLNASRVSFGGSEFSRIFINTSTSSNTYTFTLYAKSDTSKKFRFRISDTSGTQYSEDFVTTSEWQRFSYEFIGDPSTCAICNSSDANSVSIDIYGFQLEQGSYPTSYIKSNIGSATTRLGEAASGSGSAATFNDSEGCLMAEISALADDGTYRQLGITNFPSYNYQVNISLENNSNQLAGVIFSNNVYYVLNYEVQDTKTNNKVALKYKVNDLSFYVNGFKVNAITTAALSTGLDVLKFNVGNNLNRFYGKVKQVQYFDSALTDTQLEELTSWDSFSDMANGQLYTIE